MPLIGRSLLSPSPLTSLPTVSLIAAPEMALTTVATLSVCHGFHVPVAASTCGRSDAKRP